MHMSGTVLGYQKEKHLLLIITVFLLTQPICSCMSLCVYVHLSVHASVVCINREPLQDTLMSWHITTPAGARTGKHSQEDIKQHLGKLLYPNTY